MSHIKSTFSIKDLENFSGIKAHTIRIWEKRYGLLNPERTDTNIRFYSLESLKKLLNLALLNSEGVKISKLAKLDNDSFETLLEETVTNKVNKNQFINKLKLAMLNFDFILFEEAYKEIKKSLSFSEIFTNYFVPFLGDIGLLWQSGSINPTHEHFISNIIRQKILLESYHLQLKEVRKNDKLFVLFLPDEEIHDLGLTYLQYEVLKAGYKSIMLGASVPIDSLQRFINDNNEVVFVSYFTVQPTIEKIPEYLQDFYCKLLANNNAKFFILGKQVEYINNEIQIPEQIILYQSISQVITDINTI
jgi:MerR family transcriptional regulator, light-induced transcriptional regulator